MHPLFIIGGVLAATALLALILEGRAAASQQAEFPGSIDPRDVEALARVLASESSDGGDAERTWIAWTVVNRAHREGKTIYAMECCPWRKQLGANPPFSSARPARDQDRVLALAVLKVYPHGDPTAGAMTMFEPRLQDAAAKAGALARAGETGSRVIDGIKLSDITHFKSYYKTAADVRRDWSKRLEVAGNVGRFEFYRPRNA